MEMNEINSNDNTKDAAVTVIEAYKKYGNSNIVLRGLNMTVKEGTIYGLLGPSGCGKTTLLNCILGRSELDGGVIKVKSKTVADIGYMPQEISLYNEFSIMETMTYYGKLFGISDKEIVKRTEELAVLLELPKKTKIVGAMSGGQCRRVSFAVALVHHPKLLILDEPTAGVDPILSASIWDKLVLMAEMENKTIIVTTHYIEETRRAHTIGLMRNGKLLAENSPSELLTQYNSSTLEDVFLQLCEKRHTSSIGQTFNNNEMKENFNFMSKSTSQVPIKQNFKCSWDIVFAVTMKNFYWMKRNKPIMLFLFLIPFIKCSLYSMCIGNEPAGLQLALVNEELSRISSCDSLPLNGYNFSVPLSCRYIKKLQQKSYKLIEYNDIDTGKNAVKKNKVWGLIYFPKNYTVSMIERITLGMSANDALLTQSDIQIWLDLSNERIGDQMERDILDAYEEYLQEVFSEFKWPSDLAKSPIQIQNAVFGKNKPNFRDSTTSSLICVFHFYTTMFFTTHAMIMEKMSGSLNRSLISGVTVLEVAISHGIIQILILSIQSATMMLTLFVLFDNPLLTGKLLWIEILVLSNGVSGMFYGFLIATMTDSYRTALYFCFGNTYSFFILSGAVWPLEGMHPILRFFSNMIPVTLSGEAFLALSIKDYSISNPLVYKGFFSNFIWCCVFISITTIVLKKNKTLLHK